MGQIMDAVQECLKNHDWQFERDDERNLIKSGFKGKSASFRIFFDAREEQEQLLLYVICPNHIPDDMRVAAAEFLTRANYGLKFGNFEMDMNEGEVRYKVSVDVEGAALTPIMVRNMMGQAIPVTDRYFPGLMAICYGGMSASDAITKIEQ